MKDKKNNWFPLFSTHFAGAFNDNLLKNLICFIGVLWVAKGSESTVIMIASALLVVPYIVLSPLAGSLSKKMSKRKVMVVAKIAEIPIMVLAVAGFLYQSIVIVLIAMMFMGIQSALFSPSKYGLIRDIGGNEGISFGTGTMEMLTFISILIGTFVAGLTSDVQIHQLWFIVVLLIGTAVVGLILSVFIKANESATESSVGDSINPIMFLKDSYLWAKKIKGLNMVIFSLGMFWFIASFIQMNLLIYCPKILHLSNTQTSLIMASMAVGIGLGCFAAGAIARKRVEIGLIPIGGIGLSLSLLCIFLFNPGTVGFAILLVLASFFGGFFKVPLNAWIQDKVEGRKLGDMLAYDNLVEFIFILFSAALFGLLEKVIGTKFVFLVIALSAIVSTFITLFRIPSIKTMFLRLIFQFFGNIFFHFHIYGKQNLPKKQGGILIGNHISLLDVFLITSSIPRIMRFVLVQDFFKNKYFSKFLYAVKTIPISQKPNRQELKLFYENCIKVIQADELISIFPEGQMSRTGLVLEFKRGIEQIAKTTKAPLIPIHMDNVVGSPLSFISGTSITYPFKFSNLRRPVFISFGEPIFSAISAHQLRLKILELGAQNFVYRIKQQKELGHKCYKSLKNKQNTLQINQQKFFFREVEKMVLLLIRKLDEKACNAIHAEEKILKNNCFINLALLLQQKPCYVNSTPDNCFVINSDAETWLMTNAHHKSNIKTNFKNLARIYIANGNCFSLQTLFASYQSINQSINCNLCNSFIILAKDLPDLFAATLAFSIPLFAARSFCWYNNSATIEEIICMNIESNAMILLSEKDFILLYQLLIEGKINNMNNLHLLVFVSKEVNQEILEYFYNQTNIALHILCILPEVGLFSLQTRGFKGRDSTGVISEQRGYKTNSIGKPLCGMAYKIVKQNCEDAEIGEFGQLYVKGCFLFSGNDVATDELQWIDTKQFAASDAEGFITLKI